MIAEKAQYISFSARIVNPFSEYWDHTGSVIAGWDENGIAFVSILLAGDVHCVRADEVQIF